MREDIKNRNLSAKITIPKELQDLLDQNQTGLLLLKIVEIIGEDNCKCGKKGKYFLVHGRAKEAEIRGCSDAR